MSPFNVLPSIEDELFNHLYPVRLSNLIFQFNRSSLPNKLYCVLACCMPHFNIMWFHYCLQCTYLAILLPRLRLASTARSIYIQANLARDTWLFSPFCQFFRSHSDKALYLIYFQEKLGGQFPLDSPLVLVLWELKSTLIL